MASQNRARAQWLIGRDWRLGLAAVLATALTACASPTVPLDELAVEAREYDGREVTTYGVVAEYGEEDGAIEPHFVIQDADDNRVRLLPAEAAEGHVGSPVEVTGAFTFDEARGRSLHVDSIEQADG